MNRAQRRLEKKRAKQAARARPEAALQDAVGHFQHGRRNEAAEICRRILTAKPGQADARHLLGIICFQAGELETARQHIAQAIKTSPRAIFYSSLGIVLKAQGELDEAESSFRKAIETEPGYAEAHYNLGNLLKDRGRSDQAEASYRQAMAIRPDYAEVLGNLGHLLNELDRPGEALACCRQALALRKNYLTAWINKGVALRELGQFDEAEASFRKAITLQENSADAHFALAGLLKSTGRSNEAAACYREVVRLQPEHGAAYRLWAHSQKHREHGPDVRAMEQAYKQAGDNREYKMHLAFGLGKIFEELGRHDEAFSFFQTGNQIKHEGFNTPLASESDAFFTALRDHFNARLFAQHQDTRNAGAGSIFILGMPRSGTTLVEQVLASHSRVYGGGELPTLPRLIETAFAGLEGVDLVRALATAPASSLEKLGQDYLASSRKMAGKAIYVSDKRPLNFIHVGLIRLILPQAKIIHCRRDPLDTCWSIFKSYFPTRNFQFADDLPELGRYYNHYRDLMQHWRRVLPGFVHDLHYENMVQEQESETRKLLAFCNLDWEPACLDFHKTRRAVQTASAEQVRQPIYKSAVHYARRYEKHLAPLIEILESR